MSNSSMSIISNKIGQSRPQAVRNTVIYLYGLAFVIFSLLTVLLLLKPV